MVRCFMSTNRVALSKSGILTEGEAMNGDYSPEMLSASCLFPMMLSFTNYISKK